jgi:hypothetical protein
VRRSLVEVQVECCAEIDIGKDEVVACVRTPAARGRGRRTAGPAIRSEVLDVVAMVEPCGESL